ncbi:MAG: SRPBCC family protein [Planctomycetota bacterium]
MPGFHREIQIQSPPEKVFESATDLSQIGRWLGEVRSIELLQDGPVRVGTKFKQTRLLRGQEVSTVVEIIEHRGADAGSPPYAHTARSEMMGVRGEYRYQFEDDGSGGTRVKLEASAEATNLLARALVGVASQGMEEEDGEQLERLKKLVEELG